MSRASNKERGAVMLEAAIAIPILIFVLLQGFELTRLAELQLVKRDITRTLALAKTCANKQSTICQTDPASQKILCSANLQTPARICLENTIAEVKNYTLSRFPGFQVYLHAYTLGDDPATPGEDIQTRIANVCPDSNPTPALANLMVHKVVDTPRPANFIRSYGFDDPEKTDGPMMSDQPNSDAFLKATSDVNVGVQLCRTGSVYIVEFTLERESLYSLNLLGLIFPDTEPTNPKSKHYEVAIF